ncbi:histidinol dehydrogenase [Peptoniphilus catoniae]|uniref:histidinol dehydrogenase n=1 Tax=Peptoniphilus catoniae TaxID=1660341 RepID=UPI0010FD4B19|nr:histidinol dehydrogenase [Peptoniphilus catoniae]
MKYIKQGKTVNFTDNEDISQIVKGIIKDIRENKDKALMDYSIKFDDSKRTCFRVSKDEIEEAYSKLSDNEIKDLKAAYKNIEAFAKEQRKSIKEVENFSPQEGIFLGHRIIPIKSCACYVPGGNYPLFSTALMLITPAKIAGVERVVACSPVRKGSDKIDYKTLVAMDIAGADEIYAFGGVQAIAALTYGTETIKPVNLIVGPGNKYVTEAKRQCYGQIGIDFLAGPSEVLIIADKYANPDIIAADLLAQAEHDVNAKSILITNSSQLAERTLDCLKEELKNLKTKDIASVSWENNGEIILVEDLKEAVDYANDYAPEHLEVNIEDPDTIIKDLVNYGSLFIGENTAEVFGDYASGTNHTLPTLKAARYTGGLWVGKFLKICTHQKMTKAASKKISPLVSRLAEDEGLSAHSLAAKKRL